MPTPWAAPTVPAQPGRWCRRPAAWCWNTRATHWPGPPDPARRRGDGGATHARTGCRTDAGSAPALVSPVRAPPARG
jgi:hypothetical protein